MPAPKKPNTVAATAAVRRRGQETMARKLRAAGWTCTPPEGELHRSPDYVAPSRPVCRCDWLGEGTPSHEPSALCRSLRPDGPRSTPQVELP